MALRFKVCLAFTVAWLVAALVAQVAAAQNISVDGRLSPAQTLAGPNYAITANLGKQVGSNLFHSFGKFGLATPETATFSGPATVNNVIGRVTGGSQSTIDGKIASTIAGASLYLINPGGIVFGPNATVNVSGGFHASTADYLRMSDGAKFQATNPDASTLSAAPPAAFGFLTATPAALTVNGSTLGPVPGTLGLVAGPVTISGATLRAPAGTIHVAGVAGTGEVPVDPRNTPALTVMSFAPVAVEGKSKLDVSNAGAPGSGGSVFIHSGALTIDASEINADNFGPGPGGTLVLRGDNQITLSNGANIHAIAQGSGSGAGVTISTAPAGIISADASTVLVAAAASGDSGSLSVSTGQLSLTNGAILESRVEGSGRGGDISVAVTNGLVLDGSARPSLAIGIPATGIASITRATSASGNAGNIVISAGSLSILNTGGIANTTFGSANSGNISVDVGGQLAIDQTTAPAGRPGVVLGINSQSSGTGNSGDVTINAGALSIRNRGAITSIAFGAGDGATEIVNTGTLTIVNSGRISSDTFADGKGGNIVINVAGALLIDGTSATSLSEISASTAGGGRAGNVTVTAGTLRLVTNAVIETDAEDGKGNAGDVTVNVAGALSIVGNGIALPAAISSRSFGCFVPILGCNTGNAGNVMVSAGSLSMNNFGQISTQTFGAPGVVSPGIGGDVTVTVAGDAVIAGSSGILAQSVFGPGDAGKVNVNAGNLSILTNGQISSSTSRTGNRGNAGEVDVSAGSLLMGNGGTISTSTAGSGAGGTIAVKIAGNTALGSGALITAATTAEGKGGTVQVTAQGALSLTDPGTRIIASASSAASGDAGSVTVTAPQIAITGGAQISSTTAGTGMGGSVMVMTPGALVLDGAGVAKTQIAASATGSQSGPGGSVTVEADTLTVAGGAQIASTTAGTGSGGPVQVSALGPLTLTDRGSGIVASASSTAIGDGGSVTVSAPQIAITRGAEIASTTAGTGTGGPVMVTTPGALVLDGAGVADTRIAASAIGLHSGPGGSVTVEADTLTVAGGAQIASTTAGTGSGGPVQVSALGPLTLTDPGSGIVASASSTASGDGGSVTVGAPQISITRGAEIASTTAGTGKGGPIIVMTPGILALDGAGVANTQIAASATELQSGPGGSVTVEADTLTVTGGAQIASTTAGPGSGGPVQVSTLGPLTLTDPGSGIVASASSTASGDGGSVTVGAPQITITSGAEIASTTAGTGKGGPVIVTTPGMLALDGAGFADTQIAASAIGPQSGPGGSVTVGANTLTIAGGAQIASTTAGPGKGGDVAVTVANGVTLSGGGPNGASGVSAAALQGSSGAAGEVMLMAGGAIVLSNGAAATSSTAGAGKGGSVQVTAGGPLSLTGAGTGIIALANAAASGDAGSVTVSAPQIAITRGAEIASTTEGTGAGGSVIVSTPGMLALDGAGVADTQIAASAIGLQSGPGGDVTVAANALTIEGGARIASSTASTLETGKGGNVTITVASDIVLPDRGPQITARSTGSGDAGSITVSAVRLLMNNGASISTEAETSTANGGNITLHLRDFLYLVSSEISTSVKGETGDGGNIAIDPQLVILNHSSIIAQAIEGHGGNITITAGQFIPSSDSIISATSELGISGEIVINGPRVDVNGALVVLSTQLRGRTEVLREACAAHADRPVSSLVEAGRGGLPQDPEATLPALYIAGRDLNLNPSPQAPAGTTEAGSPPLHTTARLTMRCG